jgi:hypothetical protein
LQVFYIFYSKQLEPSEAETPYEFGLETSRRENALLRCVTAIHVVRDEDGEKVVVEHDSVIAPTSLNRCTGDTVIHSCLGPSQTRIILLVTCNCGHKFRVPRYLLDDDILEVLRIDNMPDI